MKQDLLARKAYRNRPSGNTGKKHSLKRQSNHQNQTWQGYWNYQTKDLKHGMINTLRALMGNVDSIHEQMGNVSREKKS